jgi:hypothetical protein
VVEPEEPQVQPVLLVVVEPEERRAQPVQRGAVELEEPQVQPVLLVVVEPEERRAQPVQRGAVEPGELLAVLALVAVEEPQAQRGAVELAGQRAQQDPAAAAASQMGARLGRRAAAVARALPVRTAARRGLLFPRPTRSRSLLKCRSQPRTWRSDDRGTSTSAC